MFFVNSKACQFTRSSGFTRIQKKRIWNSAVKKKLCCYYQVLTEIKYYEKLLQEFTLACLISDRHIVMDAGQQMAQTRKPWQPCTKEGWRPLTSVINPHCELIISEIDYCYCWWWMKSWVRGSFKGNSGLNRGLGNLIVALVCRHLVVPGVVLANSLKISIFNIPFCTIHISI